MKTSRRPRVGSGRFAGMQLVLQHFCENPPMQLSLCRVLEKFLIALFKLKRSGFRLQATSREEAASVNKRRTPLGEAATKHKRPKLA
ncbi:hypothetical protein HUU05_15250 [candidate division KSB1 bacterium]|nr:hypothetical protein [candidate division KSB1 bacterium]